MDEQSVMKHANSTSMVSITSVAALLALAADSNAQALNVEQLEQAFANDRQMTVVNSVEQLPGDVIRVVGFQNRAIADLGELWHISGNVEDPSTMPTAQHIFSAVSDRHFFVLIQRPRPGWAAPDQNVQLILGEIDAEYYCTYVYRDLAIGSLRLDIFQSDFNRRDRVTTPTHSDCEVQRRSR